MEQDRQPLFVFPIHSEVETDTFSLTNYAFPVAWIPVDTFPLSVEICMANFETTFSGMSYDHPEWQGLIPS